VLLEVVGDGVEHHCFWRVEVFEKEEEEERKKKGDDELNGSNGRREEEAATSQLATACDGAFFSFFLFLQCHALRCVRF
jgi:hypothetical protein